MTASFPPPGLDGTYSATCVRCLRGTDTGVAFEGSAEWAIAGLVSLGLPVEQAVAALGWTDGSVPSGRITVPVRVCGTCAAIPGIPTGIPALGLPVVGQP
ncbi:hypothetical protein OG225_42945 (plasmid) [Nocardia sp. NBC_01377]|uniref:hypothetical protein n=1 Tax=Nocardia sp. NBC_01377 TaxID=2903595 RepID=UPI002F90F9FB